MFCTPSNRRQPFSYHTKWQSSGSILVFCLFSYEKQKNNSNKKTENCIDHGISSDSRIDNLQCGHPKRAELPDVHINTGVQSKLTVGEQPL